MARATNIVVLLLVAVLSPQWARATEVSLDNDDFGGGRLVFHAAKDGQRDLSMPSLKTDVTMTISGLVNRVKVRQQFHNPGNQWVNGVYTFPLPERSAVDHLSMHIGERIIEGQIQKRAQARQTYRSAKAQGRKATLLEQQRSNIFTTNVANIGPGEQVVVEIEYQQILRYDQGEFSVRFPMVVAPRYIPGSKVIEGFSGSGWAKSTDKVSDAPLITPQTKADDNDSPQHVSFNIHLQTGAPVSSVTSDFHPIAVTELGEDSFDISLKKGKTLANRDFVLRWRFAPSDTPQGAYFTQQLDGETYALLMVLPPLADSYEGKVSNKELIFVIDTSGSMHGESINQAKSALLAGLRRLKPGDYFNVVQFNSSTDSLFSQAVEASADNIAFAERYVRSLEAEGGTDIEQALSRVLPRYEDNNRLRQVVFVTDGSVGNEQALFDQIKAQLGATRLFTVGIGSAPNSRFMRGAATLGRGTFTYIGSVEQVRAKMTALFEKIENPVLTDIILADGNQAASGDVLDFWPNPVKDLYLGEPVVVSLKLPPDIQNLSIRGKVAGKPWQMDLPVDTGGGEKGLDVLWARNKILSLSESARTAVERRQVEQSITELGLKYHLVSRYTSLVAVDVTPTKPTDEQAEDRALANHQPDGWTKHKPFGELPRGATGAPLNLLIGLLLLLLTAMVQLGCRRYR